jgi:16S rRNA (adenine1518-N6/adenine1519-N6)-dimethyltransferase
VKTRRRFGQHFLAPAWADKVVDAIGPRPDDRFLEIGPGPGALTLRLAPRVAHLTSVEVDRDLARDLAPRLPPNATVVPADVLDFDVAPLVSAGPLRVAGNLPYNISSPILFKLLEINKRERASFPANEEVRAEPSDRALSPLPLDSLSIRDATLMLQREVADRLAARPGTKDYGVLTVFVTAQAEVERLLTLPPGAFRPAPKVHSALVRLTFKPDVVPATLRDTFERMVRSMFTQRRKTLGNALRPFADSVGAVASQALSAAGIDATRRPETLSLPDLVALASALKAPGSAPQP